MENGPVSFFSGISSGIDFRSLVDEIIRAKQRPAELMRSRITGIESRSAAYAGLRDAVAGFLDAAADLAYGTAFGGRTASVSGFSAAAGSPIIATASPGAPTGSYGVRVLQKASAEQVAGNDFATSGQALGLTGEFFINGARVEVFATDALSDVATRINTATSTGSNPALASVLSTGPDAHRIVLTAGSVGENGVDLVEGSGGILRSLGFVDSTTTLKHTTSNGALSDVFNASDVGMSTTMGLVAIPPVATITLGLGPAAFTVDVDLSSESLSQIAANINAQASGAGSAVTASVIQETTENGTGYRLDIDGTTAFTDANGVLEVLGILEGGRGAVAQELRSSTAFEDGASQPATAATSLQNLRIGGQAANVQTGDTLTLSGRRGDGSTFSFTHTVGASDVFQDLLDRLNSNVDGLQSGSRTATATISALGELVVTDDVGGASQLSLSITANNEGGGTLDFGAVDTAQRGREREVVAGQDALLEVNGAIFQRSSNAISDAVPDVTIDVIKADPNTLLNVSVSENPGGTLEAVQALVDSYNTIVDYIEEQSAPVSEGQNTRPFSGNVTVRGIRNRLKQTLQTTLAPGAAGSHNRLANVGIEIDREGRFTLDAGKFDQEFTIDPVAVERLFAAYGEANSSGLRYLAASDDTVSGSYQIDVTQVAARATLTGSGFGGTYVDDATADTLTLTDIGSGSSYDVSLSNGMSIQDIVDAINIEVQDARAHQITGSETFFSDAVGTQAVATTTLDQLFSSGGSNFGVASGDTITISGSRSGGVSFTLDYAVVDASTQTLGDLLSQIDVQFGSDASASLQNGQIVLDAPQTGPSSIALTLTSDNAGGGSLNFGSFVDTVVGRSEVDIVASDNGGQLQLDHGSYGAGQGFDIQFTAGGSGGTASLGLTTGQHAGIDVQGTIGGLAATGEGRILTGDTGSAISGLAVEVVGSTLGQLGDVRYSRGIAALVENLAGEMTDGEADSIDALADRGDETIRRLTARIDRFEDLLENRREALLKKFVSLEEAFARSQSQSSFLLSTIGGVSFSPPAS